METIIIKNRERLNRGKLNNFSDLPESKQTIFKEIKKFIDKEHNKDVRVQIYGSYYLGFWDELSDYDVAIAQPGIDCNVLSKKATDKLNLKIQIFYLISNVDTISIPNESI